MPLPRTNNPIIRLEEISCNAWPALQTLLYEGWILRFAEGYTKRANSINPLYQSSENNENTEQKINYCQRWFRGNRLPVIFKLTAASRPGNLDALLEQQGYEKIDPTSVQTLDLRQFQSAETGPSSLATQLDEDWLKCFRNFTDLNPLQAQTLTRMLGNGKAQNFYAKLMAKGQAVACGLGVKEDSYFGLFDIVVAESERGKGYGKRLLQNLLTRAREEACTTAYLQVMVSNTRALEMYASLGFQEQYRYWYRKKT